MVGITASSLPMQFDLRGECLKISEILLNAIVYFVGMLSNGNLTR